MYSVAMPLPTAQTLGILVGVAALAQHTVTQRATNARSMDRTQDALATVTELPHMFAEVVTATFCTNAQQPICKRNAQGSGQSSKVTTC